MDMNEIIYTYDETKRPEGVTLVGAPLRNLTAGDVAGFGPMLVRQVEAAPWYVPVAPADEEE